MEFNSEEITKIISEVRIEQGISPKINDETISVIVKQGMYLINQNCGVYVDYSKDLEARELLKNYVLYANYNRLAEYKELYAGDYAKLQAQYFADTSI